MSTNILQSLKLKFNLCMEKQKWQISLYLRIVVWTISNKVLSTCILLSNKG
jgi:hypothetical protein